MYEHFFHNVSILYLVNILVLFKEKKIIVLYFKHRLSSIFLLLLVGYYYYYAHIYEKNKNSRLSFKSKASEKMDLVSLVFL